MNITAWDFEHLFDVSMEWNKADWAIHSNRWDFNEAPKDGFIYWCEDYASLVLCREFLASGNYTYLQSFDEGTEQWAFISDYDFHSARVSA